MIFHNQNLGTGTVRMQLVVWSLLILLTVLHQIRWGWPADALAGGAVPAALVYHAGLSVAAAFVWYLATRYAWPIDADALPPAETGSPTEAGPEETA